MTESPSGAKLTFDEAADREAQALAARATTAGVERVETVGAIEPAIRAALYSLLSTLADNKYVLGRRYVEWCTGAPMLESAVAAAAMAQDELGHARSFYPLLRGFPEASEADTAEERGWQERPTSALACLDRPFDGWHQFVAANLVVDTALTTLLEAATGCPYEPLRQRARKIIQEEAAHWTHAVGWVERLAAEGELRGRLAESLRAIWPDAFCWFGRADDPLLGTLVEAGLLAERPEALRARLRARLLAVLDPADLAYVAVDDLPWERWDPRARRLREAGS